MTNHHLLPDTVVSYQSLSPHTILPLYRGSPPLEGEYGRSDKYHVVLKIKKEFSFKTTFQAFDYSIDILFGRMHFLEILISALTKIIYDSLYVCFLRLCQ